MNVIFFMGGTGFLGCDILGKSLFFSQYTPKQLHPLRTQLNHTMICAQWQVALKKRSGDVPPRFDKFR